MKPESQGNGNDETGQSTKKEEAEIAAELHVFLKSHNADIFKPADQHGQRHDANDVEHPRIAEILGGQRCRKPQDERCAQCLDDAQRPRRIEILAAGIAVLNQCRTDAEI